MADLTLKIERVRTVWHCVN